VTGLKSVSFVKIRLGHECRSLVALGMYHNKS
jgi:hypothetical protein